MGGLHCHELAPFFPWPPPFCIPPTLDAPLCQCSDIRVCIHECTPDKLGVRARPVKGSAAPAASGMPIRLYPAAHLHELWGGSWAGSFSHMWLHQQQSRRHRSSSDAQPNCTAGKAQARAVPPCPAPHVLLDLAKRGAAQLQHIQHLAAGSG